MYKSKNTLLTLSDGFVSQIEQASEHQIDELIFLVSHRYNQLRPEREGMFLTPSKDLTQRHTELEQLTRLLLVDISPA